MVTQKLRKKGKKQWYAVIAPKVFREHVVGEVISYEPKQLVGKQIKLTYSSITQNPRDRDKSFVLEIIEVTQEKAHTVPKRILYSESYIQRTGRRSKSRALHVGKYRTKDGKNITFKLYLLYGKKIVRAVTSNLIKHTAAFLTNQLQKTDAENIFEPNYLESLGKLIKSKLKKIYPISSVVFWKVILE